MNYIHILYELGALPKDFYSIFKVSDINDFVLKIDIQSPISRQQEMEDAQQAFMILQAMLQTDEQATRTVFKMEDMFSELGSVLGIKAKYIRNETERQELKAAQQKQLEDMQNKDAERDVKKEAAINALKPTK
jgi:hypothetical protein